MNLIHTYRSWKIRRKMKKEYPLLLRNTKWFEPKLLVPGEVIKVDENTDSWEILNFGWKPLRKFGDRARNWNRFGWRYFNPKTVSYTVDVDKLDEFLRDKKLTDSK